MNISLLSNLTTKYEDLIDEACENMVRMTAMLAELVDLQKQILLQLQSNIERDSEN